MKHLFAVLGAAAPLTAMAGFQVVNEPSQQPVMIAAVAPAPVTATTVPSAAVAEAPLAASGASASASKGVGLVAVRYVGTADRDIPVRAGFGRDVKLAEALKQIAPAGWTPMFNDGVVEAFIDRGRLVSWRGGRKWTEVLDVLAYENDVVVDLDWSRHTLNVGFKKSASSAPAVTPSATAAVQPSEPAVPTKEVWIIRQGYPIGQELKGWAKRAGWNVVWGLQRDVIAPTTTTFSGDFASAASEVVRTLAENGALIHAQIFDGNHTLVVQGPGVAPQ
ncbi:TcpQ domain-containing protein [Paraburkholderia sediminicola]|uniref:TcpQ domain-containing protein n=1 Tax=Paraburkholderia sediminicola TaxID=458836 RepID=UPI0038BA609E